MNLFDMMVIVIFAFCVIRGVFRGLIKELSSIVGVLAGFYAAYSYYTVIARPLSQWLTKSEYANILAFLFIFCLIFLVVSIIGIVIKYVMNIAFMGWVDRICGAAFGAIKGLLIVAVLLIVFTAFLSKGTPFMKDSMLAPHIAIISEKMAKVVSKDMKRQFTSKIQELKKTW